MQLPKLFKPAEPVLNHFLREYPKFMLFIFTLYPLDTDKEAYFLRLTYITHMVLLAVNFKLLACKKTGL